MLPMVKIHDEKREKKREQSGSGCDEKRDEKALSRHIRKVKALPVGTEDVRHGRNG